MKNKKEASEYLGISPRALEYHQKKKRLSVRYERGKTGDEAMYDEAELRNLKARLKKPVRATSAAVEDTLEQTKSQGLTTLRGYDTGLFAALPEAIMQLIAETKTNVVAVPVHEKAILSVVEASQFGISRNELLEAIHAKKLKARKRHGWRIKRSDLDAFIKKL